MIKSKLVPTIYGPRRVIENYKDHARLYVMRTNLKTYVVSTASQLSLDTMVKIAGEYHFSTLKQLHTELNND